MKVPSLLLCLAWIASPAWSATYVVQADHNAGKLHVTVTLNEGDTASAFEMPAWAPGDYRILNFGKGVSEAEFTNAEGAKVSAEHKTANSWTTAAPVKRVSYWVLDTSGPTLFADFLRVTKDECTFDGPAALGYFVGHQKENQKLIVAKTLAADVECSLERVESSDASTATFMAPDYDTLIDCPVVHSVRLRTKEFNVLGKPHKLVFFNRSSGVDIESFQAVCEKIIPQAAAMMGGLPYPRYHFIFDFGGGGGGLEHLFSTKIGIGPNFSAASLADFIAHEYFHVWNVKRIRAKPLGPFDYQREAVTGTLWWLEGVTDYYAKVLTYRAGLWGRRQFLDQLSTSVYELSTVSARNQVSADECSRRVWEAHNSEGFGGMSYYLKGEVIGLCLDLAIRCESEGKHSLDDVMRQLFAECSNGKPGYGETRIRELCVKFGGDALGPLYDACVMKPGEVPVYEWLPKLGFAWTDNGIEIDPKASPTSKRLGNSWPN